MPDISNRVNVELREILARNEASLARLDAECNHRRSLEHARQQSGLIDQTVNNESINIAANRQILNKRKKKRNHSSSSSSSSSTSLSSS